MMHPKLNRKLNSNKDNIVRIYLVYFVIVTLYLLLLIGNYPYLNFHLVVFSLSFYYIGYVAINEFVNVGLISIKFIFNVFGFLYTNYHIIELVVDKTIINEYYYYGMELSYLAMFSFNTAYSLTKCSTLEHHIRRKLDVGKFNYGLLVILILSVAAFYYVVVQGIGILNYFLVSRAERSLMRADYSFLTFYSITLPMISTLSLFIYMQYRKKLNLLLFFMAFLLTILNSVLTASRADMFSAVLPVIVILNYNKILSNKITIIIGAAGFVLFGVWKSLYNSEIETQYGEFSTWYEICKNVLSHPQSYSLAYYPGKSYLDTLLNLVVPVTGIEPLSRWYLRTFEPLVYQAGGGRGFSSVLEAFLNFNVFGVISIYVLYGIIAKKIFPKSEMTMIINLLAIVSINMLFRSESYAFWKNMLWLRIYPILLLYYFASRKIVFKSRSNTYECS